MISDSRLTHLNEWINETLGITSYSLTPVSGDASFRRYFRLVTDSEAYIAVDAPPEKENNEAFVKVTHLLEAEGLPVPHLYYSSLDFGFFLISDFGDDLFINILNTKTVSSLYEKAFNALTIIQQIPAMSLPSYNQNLLLQEMELFREWFLNKNLSITLTSTESNLISQVFAGLIDNALAQPQVFVHRDYHSRNLMQLDGNHPGIIDYQDAVYGPVTYDLVSLLRDCYIEWPLAQVETWALSYRIRLLNKNIIHTVDEQTFIKWFDLMGIQRQLKAIGIFSRLNIRDKKPNYLKDIPRTLNYIKIIAPKYSETQALANFIQDQVSL